MKDYKELFERSCEGVTQGAEGWFSAWCPFHESGGKGAGHKTPSFAFHQESGGWKCFGCLKAGDAIDFAGLQSVAGYDPGNKEDRNKAIRAVHEILPWFELNGKNKGEQKPKKGPILTEASLGKLHEALINNSEAMQYLEVYRGWTAKTIQSYKIGISNCQKYFTIPIYAGGHLVNIRKYSPKGSKPWNESAPKIKGIQGRNEVRIFPDSILEEEQERIFLVEGEADALAAISVGLSAITFTGGAGNTPSDLHRLQDREIAILYDNDDAGTKGAKRVAQALRKYTQQIKIVSLEEISPNSSDLTEALVDGVDAKTILEKTAKTDFQPSNLVRHTHVRDVGFDEAINSTNIGSKIRLKAMVMGTRERPYAALSRVVAVCQSAGSQPICSLCPLSSGHGAYPSGIDDRISEKDVLNQIRKTEFTVSKIIKNLCGFLCEKFEVDPIASTIESIYELVIGPYHDDATEESIGFQQRTVFSLNNGRQHRINQPYLFEGVTLPQPWDQANTHVFTGHKEIERAVDGFVLSEEDRRRLEVFQPPTK